MGATLLTAGHSLRIASASCGVSVMTLPEPKVTPPLDAVPGEGEFHRVAEAHEPRQTLTPAATGNDPDVQLRLP